MDIQKEDKCPRKNREVQGKIVAKGYRQKVGIDYDEAFALVARMETIRLFNFMETQNKWSIYQMDVKLLFLNIVFKKKVYIE